MNIACCLIVLIAISGIPEIESIIVWPVWRLLKLNTIWRKSPTPTIINNYNYYNNNYFNTQLLINNNTFSFTFFPITISDNPTKITSSSLPIQPSSANNSLPGASIVSKNEATQHIGATPADKITPITPHGSETEVLPRLEL